MRTWSGAGDWKPPLFSGAECKRVAVVARYDGTRVTRIRAAGENRERCNRSSKKSLLDGSDITSLPPLCYRTSIRSRDP